MTRRVCPPCQRGDHESCPSRQACQCPVCERLVWSEPPVFRRARTDWLPDEEMRRELRRRRRRARVFVGPPRRARYAVGRIRGGMVAELPAEHWEAGSACLPDGECGLWLRYIGPELEEDHAPSVGP